MTSGLWRNVSAHINQHTTYILLVLPLPACSGLSFVTVLNICCLKNSQNNCVPCHGSLLTSQTPDRTAGNHAKHWADVIQSWIHAKLNYSKQMTISSVAENMQDCHIPDEKHMSNWKCSIFGNMKGVFEKQSSRKQSSVLCPWTDICTSEPTW